MPSILVVCACCTKELCELRPKWLSAICAPLGILIPSQPKGSKLEEVIFVRNQEEKCQQFSDVLIQDWIDFHLEIFRIPLVCIFGKYQNCQLLSQFSAQQKLATCFQIQQQQLFTLSYASISSSSSTMTKQ